MKNSLQNLYQCYKRMTVERVIATLKISHNCESCTIYYQGQLITPEKFLIAYPQLKRCKAKDVYIKFFGGPLGSQQFYVGSFLNLLIDRILWDKYKKQQVVLVSSH